MPKYLPKGLIRAETYINEGNSVDSARILCEFGKKKNLSKDEKISYYILKAKLSYIIEKNKDLFEYSTKAYHESLNQENSLQLLDVYIINALSYIWNYQEEKFEFFLEKSDTLIKYLGDEPKKLIAKRIADIKFIESLNNCINLSDYDKALELGYQSLALRIELGVKVDIIDSFSLFEAIYYNLGEFEKALEYAWKILSFDKELAFKKEVFWSYTSIGLINYSRGDVDRSQEYYKKALIIANELNSEYHVSACLINLGVTYHMKGDYELAKENFESSLELFRKAGSTGITSLDELFLLSIDSGDLRKASYYLQQIEQIQEPTPLIKLVYRIDKAIYLKQSPRAINRGKAEEMLKQIVEEKIIHYDPTIIAIINLCDILFEELHNTGDPEIINEIKPYILKLLSTAEKNHSYSIQAESYILQARLALVTLELKDSRKFLTKAQTIAEKYHLDRLSVKISNEHDELLKKLSIWEEIKESNTSLAERIRLARLNDQMDHMLRKRAIGPLEIPDEDPVVVLIVSESGEPIFSYLFDEEWNFEDHLIGGFLIAINSFSDEMFAQGLDRATFGQYNLFMKSISPYLICYLYKGPSYLARQRIKLFIENIQKDKDIWDTFDKFLTTSQLVQLKDIPTIKSLINDIFIEKNVQLDIFESKTP